MLNEVKLKNVLRNLDMLVCFQNLLAHTHFNMFVDKWMSANESPENKMFLTDMLLDVTEFVNKMM